MKSSRLPSATSPASAARLLDTAKHDMSPIDYDNEKDLQKSIESIVNEFKMKDTRDWSYRYKSLLQLQRIVNGNGLEMKIWSSLLRYMTPTLIEQLTELRATIVKEACQAVSLIATRMKNRFEPYALNYVQSLIKMSVVKANLIAEATHGCLQQILSNVPTKNLLNLIITSSQDSHNELLRRRCSDYILQIIQRAINEEGMILTTSQAELEKTISRLLVDGGSEIRAVSRFCFWAYSELAEDRALSLIYEYTPTTKKNLFLMVDQLPEVQQEIAAKIQKTLNEEDQSQSLVLQSTDLDFDMSDFKRNDQDSTTTTTTTTTTSSPTNNGIRAKTPTGRQSGLKGRIPSSSTTPKISPTNSSTDLTSSTTTTTTARRAGSSLGMVKNPSTTLPEERTIRKPTDTSNIIRSKSSLGTIRKPTEIPSPTSAVKTTKASSSSPNLSTSNLSAISKPSSSLSSSTISKPSPSSLTKKPATSISPTNSTTTPKTTTTTTSTVSSPPTGLPSSLKKPVSRLSMPTAAPPTLTKSKSSLSSTAPSSSLSNSIKSIKSSTTTTTSTTSTTPSRPSLPTSAALESKRNSIKFDPAASRKSVDLSQFGATDEDITIESLEESLSFGKNSTAFNEISDALEGNIRDAKKGLSFLDVVDSTNTNELTLDDLSGPPPMQSSSKNNSNNSSSNDLTSTFNLKQNTSSNSLQDFLENSNNKSNSGVDDEFNWIEDSVDEGLIEDDTLEFDIKNNSLNNDDDEDGNGHDPINSTNENLSLGELELNS
eukprot:gene6196-7717_t